VFRELRSLVCLLSAAILVLPQASYGEAQLSREEVELILAQAATKADQLKQKSIIAVTDREGFLLGLWDMAHRLPPQLPVIVFPNLGNPALRKQNDVVLKIYSLAAGAITRASTAAFLSSNENAFTSRTAGFIIQQHFPPGIRNTSTGPLVGVGLSSLFFTDVNRVKIIPPGFDGAAPVPVGTSPGVRAPLFALTSLNDSPGGVPLYKGGRLVGGIGVTGDGHPTNLTPAGAIFFKETQRNATTGFKTGPDFDEEIALAGQSNFRPPNGILGSNVLINGIRIPYVYPEVDQIKDVEDTQPLGSFGNAVDTPLLKVAATDPTVFTTGMPQASPALFPYEHATLGGVDGEIRFPFRADPVAAIPGREKIGKASRLSVGDVQDIISKAADRAGKTRAGIRLPIGTKMQVFISVVNNPNKAGEAPQILGIFRTGEATIFSWDVSAQKARTALFFSNRQLAMSARTVGFLAQRYYPPGLDGRPHGPFFGFQEAVSLRQRPLREQKNGAFPFPGNPNLPNGITIFPGGIPLYRDGYLIGAIGVSGDGVDQDDIVTASGTENFQAPRNIRADSYTYRGARLPYAKFPRDPEQ
jgi:uncharacterized protein GlcG (DUF336 family)